VKNIPMNLEKEIEKIQERNRRVGLDKAWETSFTRRGFIALVTYIIASMWLIISDDGVPWLKAIVPAGGYILSTLSLPLVKKWWCERK
jgi:hypothetical protein